jgi:hypothetical protein
MTIADALQQLTHVLVNCLPEEIDNLSIALFLGAGLIDLEPIRYPKAQDW